MMHSSVKYKIMKEQMAGSLFYLSVGRMRFLFICQLSIKTLKWKDSFLCLRQRVVVNGVKSHWAPVLSGVPQCTLLGPLFFSLYL